jgi:hypothetical protein
VGARIQAVYITYAICGEGDVAVLQQFVTEQIGEGVVFLVEGEDSGVGGTLDKRVNKGQT